MTHCTELPPTRRRRLRGWLLGLLALLPLVAARQRGVRGGGDYRRRQSGDDQPGRQHLVLHWAGAPAILARSRLTDGQTGRVIDPTDPAYTNGYPLTLTAKVRRLTWQYLGD